MHDDNASESEKDHDAAQDRIALIGSGGVAQDSGPSAHEGRTLKPMNIQSYLRSRFSARYAREDAAAEPAALRQRGDSESTGGLNRGGTMNAAIILILVVGVCLISFLVYEAFWGKNGGVLGVFATAAPISTATLEATATGTSTPTATLTTTATVTSTATVTPTATITPTATATR